MVKMINRHTGTEMWVSDNRKDEYLAAGHKLAAVPVKEAPAAKPKATTKSKAKK